MRPLFLAAVVGCLSPLAAPAQQQTPVEKGVVRFEPAGDQHEVPERYRLAAHQFSFEMTRKREMPASGLDVYDLRFPSPVKSPCPENNTVYAEYYRPRGDGPFPCVIVLDIMAGNQSVARMMATHLAQHRIAGLCIHMPYYGPRRPPGSSLRLLSPDVERSIAAVRQAILDLRRATAWMAARPEIDAKRLGIVGTSLGSFLAALTAEMEPRLGRVGVLLGGGGFVDAFYDDPRVLLLRAAWELQGGSREVVEKLIAPVDPITRAANLKDRKLLIMAAKRDDIVPPCMAEALWRATGRQRLIWFDCTHYGAVAYIVPAMKILVEHFR
jgi:dienelactone hydrolase